MWITHRQPPSDLGNGETLRVTTLSGTGRTIDPKRLSDLRDAATEFLQRGEGTVVLDCLDYLVLHNGPERVARALADVHDQVAVLGGVLVVFVDRRTAGPRLAAWLAREFDPLPRAVPGPSAFRPVPSRGA